MCLCTARLVPPRPGSRGAVWRTVSLAVGQGFTTTFRVVLSAPAQRCDDVRTVRSAGAARLCVQPDACLQPTQLSRSYSEEIRTRSYTACSTQAADGFAFVLYDALAVSSSSVGAGGGGLGYAGLPNSVAIEFDTMGDPSLDEPAVSHVAVLSRGVCAVSSVAGSATALLTARAPSQALPNDASHQYRLGVATPDTTLTDGKEHTVRVTYTSPVCSAAVRRRPPS